MDVSMMLHPYQRLALAKLADTSDREILLAACGPQLFSLDLSNGAVLGTWPIVPSKDKQDESDSSTEIITAPNDPDGRVRKRRKTSKKKPIATGALSSPITLLAVSNDNRYVIATTGEDKEVHVLEIGLHGDLTHLSKRRMTKRPCAISVAPKNDFVLVGDKFGDVYALPLLFDEEHRQGTDQEESVQNGTLSTQLPYKPSATNLTVHTHRNLVALKQQMSHVPSTTSKQKDVMSFPHDLLLGHVSMLTDLISVSIPSPGVDGISREYIITCDRDEHVRISRGGNQAYIIENYCFGHTQFVSRLCLIGSNILVSGGGDSHLFVWNWLEGILLGRLPIQKAVQAFWSSAFDQKQTSQDEEAQVAEDQRREGDTIAVAVSGIWSASRNKGKGLQVFCACEAVPAIFEFEMMPDENLSFSELDVEFHIHKLPGNPLDVAIFSDKTVVSIDNIHIAGSKSLLRSIDKDENDANVLMVLSSKHTDPLPVHVDQIEAVTMVEKSDFQKLSALLYGIENLRKHSNEDTE